VQLPLGGNPVRQIGSIRGVSTLPELVRAVRNVLFVNEDEVMSIEQSEPFVPRRRPITVEAGEIESHNGIHLTLIEHFPTLNSRLGGVTGGPLSNHGVIASGQASAARRCGARIHPDIHGAVLRDLRELVIFHRTPPSSFATSEAPELWSAPS